MSDKPTKAQRHILEMMDDKPGGIILRTILRKDTYRIQFHAKNKYPDVPIHSGVAQRLIAKKWVMRVFVETWYQKFAISPSGHRALEE